MFKLLKNLTKKDMAIILLSAVLIILQVYLELKIPDYMSEITRLVETDGSSMNDIILQGIYMLLCAFGSLIDSILVGYMAARVAATFSLNVRAKLYNKVSSYSMEEIKKFSTSSLITRTTNDITNIQMFLAMGLQLLIKSPIMAVWAITKILNKGLRWSIATAVAVLFLTFIAIITITLVLPKFKIVQKLIDNINGLARENLTGIRVVHAFNAEGYQEDKFDKANDTLTKTQMFNQRMLSIMQPAMYMTMNFLTLAIYMIGAVLIDKAMLVDKLTLFSNMVVFTSYAMQVIMSFLMLVIILIMYPRASVSADRINEVLETNSKILDGDKTKGIDGHIGEVEFDYVSFKYTDSEEYILRDISFKAKKGEVVAFIGSTGSGKSTLINLVPRFYDATEGNVLIDGVNVKDYKLSSLHDKLGYVPQKAVMLNGTVNYNVGYGKKENYHITNDMVVEAVKIAEGTEFIEKMDGKYEANIAAGGTNISGGQKQRIAIARAIARKPEIYIFDDSFSALDYKTDYLLRTNLKKYTKDTTNLIVAQRIGTIMNADKIIVLEDGKCVGMGTHKELLKSCKVYQEIAYSQVTKEELENGKKN